MIDNSKPETGVQALVFEDLTPVQQDRARMRLEHVLEAETGFRGGDRSRALPDEPRPEYDPGTTTLGQRRRAKVAELRALGVSESRLLGLGQVSERTLERLAAAIRRSGLAGCVDGRWVRRRVGHRSVSAEVEEAILAVHAETLHRSKVSMKTRAVLIHQYLRERHGPDARVPSYLTLWRVWKEWFGPGGARQRYARTAAATEPSGEHVVVHRPGQVIALDTTVLPVKVRETLFDEPVSVHLTLALDVYTRSLPGFRLTLVSDTSVDVAMLLREVMTPTRLREGWGEDMAWSYPGLPRKVVAEAVGFPVAGLPFFTPETVTTDHGSVYKNHHLVEVQRVLGVNVLPARVMRPTDKQTVERAFGSARSLLFELLLGYQGVDVVDRGVDPEADAVLTVAEMEHLIATWIVRVWQNRQLREHAPTWDPGGRHSPNTLFAASLAQGGFAMRIPPPELYYELLPAHHVKIHGRRGVKVRGLWYDGPALDDYRDRGSLRGGRHPGRWVVRRDPRDRRVVFFQDPGEASAWHPLRWVGLPPVGEVPCFGDARVADLLATARRDGLIPRSDAELLPVLLDLLGGHTPVDRWPSQMTKRQRTEHARDTARADAAVADRTAPDDTQLSSDAEPTSDAETLPRRWAEHARDVACAVDDERRRRREAALADPPARPPRLGAEAQRRSLFLIADEESSTTSERKQVR